MTEDGRGHSDGVESVLTPQQFRLLRLRALGLTRKEAAARLGITDPTARYHLWMAYRRLNAQTLSDAFIALGWLQVPAA